MKALFIALALLSVYFVSEGNSMKAQRSQMLYPTVVVECKGKGSGVIIESSNGFSHILTAKHVLAKKTKCRVTVYPDEITYPATVVKISKEYDLALLQIEAEHPFVAKLPNKIEFEPMTPVWKVGGGAGHIPFATRGLVGEYNEDYIMASADVVGGDSGGGLYARHANKYVLIGIITAHALEHRGSVHHVGYAHNLRAIFDFLGT